ncbi:TPA: mechanosensitive ion channel family protein [Candidatus Saccharibacteria bacterium]|nr:mechanosensitive ion channel family protein [Candidatus Saccharibacteria bacterium]HIO87897.1 mechanosensitive ion channel family protein [Candidatus Saccharibacteria bacterium]
MNETQSWIEQNQAELITVALIFVGAWLLKRFGQSVIKRLVIKAVHANAHNSDQEAEEKREETIIQIISGALNIILWPLAIILAIAQVGVDIAPLIAGASIVGVALGFGAQSLVKDIISGLFIIVENQYRVGDVVDLDGTSGSVEKITLRVTVLRDLDGVVHHVPNGTIDRTSNYSKDYSGINLNVGIAYDSDIDKAIEIINKVGQEIANDKNWKTSIIDAPSFMRVDNLGDSSVDLKLTGKVRPLKQWAVTGELRKRIKTEFDKAGIEIPFPQTVIHQVKD